MRESFFQNLVHNFDFLMSFSARSAIEQMPVKHATFAIRKLVVQIGGQPIVNFVVNRCHRFSPLRREQGEVVYAWTRALVREFLGARH